MKTTLLLVTLLSGAAPDADWARAHVDKPYMTAAETRAFMHRLARYVEANHLKTDPNSPQRGMVYEYFQVARKGEFDQWVQGEGLDTMHDGAWLAAAMVNAARATGEVRFREFLTRWQLPFYCKMLNHSDELFVPSCVRNDAKPNATPWGKTWAYQAGEKGFIPYWWDDGASVSLERMRRTGEIRLGERPCVDYLAGKPNPQGRLSGYSQGMSNHMAQDIGVMLQLSWLLLRESDDPAEKKLADEVAHAAVNLHESRMRHHGYIPMCVAPAALVTGSEELMRRVPDPNHDQLWSVGRHYMRALTAGPGEKAGVPGFADDTQYRYYYGIARAGGDVPAALAFHTVAAAYTEPMLWRYYSDDANVPAGINRFDLHHLDMIGGKPAHYRSDRKGHRGKPLPVGSRMGPQNMVACGWALQILEAMPGIWERPARKHAEDLRVYVNVHVPRWDANAPPWAKVKLGNVDLGLRSGRSALVLDGSWEGESAKIELFDGPDGKGKPAAVISLGGEAPRAVNAEGRPLEMLSCGYRGKRFQLALPYTVAKNQARWANWMEHGRYSVRVGPASRNVYVAARESDVKAWLRHELAGGLRTWEAVFDEFGYIPTGIGTGRHWDGFSDSGGYAHLISAAAEWLLCLDGKRDWTMHHIPDVLGGKKD